MTDRAFLKTLSRDIRQYDRAWKKFSANRIAESEFDFQFQQLLQTLSRPEAKVLFEAGFVSFKEPPHEMRKISLVEASDLETIADFEVRFLSDMLGSKRRLKPIIAEGLSKSKELFPDEPIDVIEIFSESHDKIKGVVSDSRKKARKEKKKDKKYVTSIVGVIAGIGCIASNIIVLPILTQVSSAAGFTSIVIAVRKLNLD